MPTVYEVLPDLNTYRYALWCDSRVNRIAQLDGTREADAWIPFPVYDVMPLHREGDFWGEFGGAFAVKRSSLAPIVKFIDQSCELLPIAMEEGPELVIMNVVYVPNCLDRKRSMFDEVDTSRIVNYVFHAERLGYSLFKIPERRHSEVLCVEGVVAPHDEFKATVERSGMTGLIFKKLWSSED